MRALTAMALFLILSLISILAPGCVTAGATGGGPWEADFCRGFKAGYTRGYCRNHGTGGMCLEPMSPMCPGFASGSFQDGYDRGYEEGTTH